VVLDLAATPGSVRDESGLDRAQCLLGVSWRDLPRAYGPWRTMYGPWSWQWQWQWQGAGRLLTSLQAQAYAAGLIAWDVNADFMICRHGLGGSQGGFTAKVYPVREQGQKLLSLLTAAGSGATVLG
jgi:hypothetical protein